jgi:hypothetical protein
MMEAHLRHAVLFSFVLLLAYVAAAQPDPSASVSELTIERPANDSIVATPTVDLEGTLVSTGGGPTAVTVIVLGGRTVQAQVSGDRWAATGVPLAGTAQRIAVRSQGVTRELLVTRAEGVAPRPRQRIRIEWALGCDAELERIARETLDAALLDAEVATFVSGVKTRFTLLLLERYAELDLELTASPAGADVHTIRMLPVAPGAFGHSPYDCGNRQLVQQSDVYVGYFRDSMVGDFPVWVPMSRQDPLEVRMEDVAQAMARTAAHELGHSLGLVGRRAGPQCAWMEGCQGGHNCPDLDASRPLADRFDDGRFVMDPGFETEFYSRIAEWFPDERGSSRAPSEFNAFSRSYLSLIHGFEAIP